MTRDERVSEVRVVSEAAFSAMLRALAPAQSHSAGLRSVAYGASGSGGLRETTADERAIDAGAVGRGSVARRRIVATSGEARVTLEWLVTYAHTGDLRTLAALYGEHAAPLELRAARDVAAVLLRAASRHLADAEGALAKVAPRGSRRPTSAAEVLRLAVEVQRQRRDGAQARATATVEACTVWGVEAMGAALDAWRGTADREAA